MQRIEGLRLMLRSPATAHDAISWPKRALRKGSPRLMKILGGQFMPFGRTRTAPQSRVGRPIADPALGVGRRGSIAPAQERYLAPDLQ